MSFKAKAERVSVGIAFVLLVFIIVSAGFSLGALLFQLIITFLNN